MKFAEASAKTLMQILRNELEDERAVRNLIESLFTPSKYNLLKNVGNSPLTNVQLKSLIHITKTINEMKPIEISEYLQIL
jgi:hypothetical protein